jgi:DUF438 domain-containing protein
MKPDVAELIPLALDIAPVAVTIFSTSGEILYYNEFAPTLLDRKPEYIGRDIRSCHLEKSSIEKIDRILEEFKQGGTRSFQYEGERKGRLLTVTISPLRKDGELLACVHMVAVKRDAP